MQIHQLFDLVVGTSVGAIIAAGLVIRRLSATMMIQELQKNASKIFPTVTATKQMPAPFLTGPLQELLTTWFGDSQMTSTTPGCKVACCGALDVLVGCLNYHFHVQLAFLAAKGEKQREAYFYRSYELPPPLAPFDGDSHATIVDALWASVAAPGIFHPRNIPSLSAFTDGHAQNPSHLVVSEALSISGVEPQCLISVGCGQYAIGKPPVAVKLANMSSPLDRSSELKYHRLSITFGPRDDLDSVVPDKMEQLIEQSNWILQTDLKHQMEATIKTLQ